MPRLVVVNVFFSATSLQTLRPSLCKLKTFCDRSVLSESELVYFKSKLKVMTFIFGNQYYESLK